MKPAPIIIVFILVLCKSISGQATDTTKFISLLPGDFQLAYQQAGKALIIDVREFFEFRKTRLPGAVNMPSSGNLEFSADTINKDTSLFLYCTSGFRSKRVAGFFYDKGFCRVNSLQGGIVAWKKKGLPLDRKRRTTHDKRRMEENKKNLS
jgi:rhodanese-related sulfurtransferase